jgi:hypothetical protein
MRPVGSFTLGLALVFACGCSSSPEGPDYGGEEGKQIANLVERMNDDTTSVAKLKASFASGVPAAKKDVKTYRRFHYDLKHAEVTGDSATGTVAIESHAGGDAVEREWTFVKEGDGWKIKSAPLP